MPRVPSPGKSHLTPSLNEVWNAAIPAAALLAITHSRGLALRAVLSCPLSGVNRCRLTKSFWWAGSGATPKRATPLPARLSAISRWPPTRPIATVPASVRSARNGTASWSGRKQAEIAQQYLRKGSLVFVEGRIQTRQWDDREGQKRTTVEIVANNFRMLGGRGEGGRRG